MPNLQNRDVRRAARLTLAGVMLALAWPAPAETNVVLHLTNGDRIAGAIISEDTNRVVLSTSWLPELPVPLTVITQREVLVLSSQTTTTNVVAPALVATPSVKPATPSVKPATPKLWAVNLNLGTTLISGAVDSELFYGQMRLTYARPLDSNPKRYFRNILGYTANYGRTGGAFFSNQTNSTLSANNMGGTEKLDLDVGDRVYLYTAGAVGFDELRKLDLYYSVGPGVGYHLFTLTNWAMNVESGITYQAENRSAGGNVESYYLRLAQDVMWQMTPRLSFTERFEFFQNVEATQEFRFQLNAAVIYALSQNLSLNLSVLDLYNTNPAPGVGNNTLQLRSTLGINF